MSFCIPSKYYEVYLILFKKNPKPCILIGYRVILVIKPLYNLYLALLLCT